VHNEKSWNGHECGEGSHTYNQGKTLVMVVNKVSFPTYHLDLDEKKRIAYNKFII
jgi:hypothetical protein